jgi:hypothetical protein
LGAGEKLSDFVVRFPLISPFYPAMESAAPRRLNQERTRMRILGWLLRITAPFGPSVQIAPIRAWVDVDHPRGGRWVADQHASARSTVGGFLVVPTHRE